MTETTTKPTKAQALAAKIESLEKLLPLLREQYAKVKYEEDNAEAIAAERTLIEVTGLDAYAKVTFVFGRKDNRKTYEGSVVAFRPASGPLPAAYKIETGVGFDTDVKTVAARDVQRAA